MARKTKTQEVKPTRDVNAGARVIIALDLKLQGYDYDTIAAKAGYASRGAAFNAIQRELQRRIAPKIDLLREIEDARYDALLMKVWPKAMDPDDKLQLFAVDRVLAISAARRELLGLDAKSDAPPGQMLIREYPPGVVEAV